MLNKEEILTGIQAISRSKKYKWSTQQEINQSNILELQDIIQEAIQKNYSKRSIFEYLSKKNHISMSQATFYRYCKALSNSLPTSPVTQVESVKKNTNKNQPPITINTEEKNKQLEKINKERQRLENPFTHNKNDVEALGLI